MSALKTPIYVQGYVRNQEVGESPKAKPRDGASDQLVLVKLLLLNVGGILAVMLWRIVLVVALCSALLYARQQFLVAKREHIARQTAVEASRELGAVKAEDPSPAKPKRHYRHRLTVNHYQHGKVRV